MQSNRKYLIAVTVALFTSHAFALVSPVQPSFVNGGGNDSDKNAIQRGFTEDTCFSPDDDCGKKLIQFISKAENTLDIAIFDVTDPEVADAIQNVAKVARVRVVVDNRQSKGAYSMVDQLVKAKVPLRIGQQAGIMHNKFSVVDRMALETGSYNYSGNARNNNNENQLYTTNPKFVNDYSARFEQIWNEARQPQ